MPNRLKIIIENDTSFALTKSDDEPNFALVAGALEEASPRPKYPLPSKTTAEIVVSTPAGSPGPDGFLRYEFETLKIVVWCSFSDATPPPQGAASQTTTEDGEVAVVSHAQPFVLQWKRLDGAIGDLDPVPVQVTDDTGKALTWTDVPWKSSVTVKFTLRVKNTAANADSPKLEMAVVTPVAGAPFGAGKAVLQSAFRTWDAPNISQKRKKLLAVLGHFFPQVYVGKGGKLSGNDPYAKVPYQQMVCWTPGHGTSCTSVNTAIERILRKSVGKWAFLAYEHKGAWVPWGSNPTKQMPSVGDIYILYRDVVANEQKTVYDKPHERHCGFIVHVPESPDEKWITADGGQTINISGDGAYLNARPWEMRVPGQPDDKKKAIWEKTLEAHTFAKPIEKIKYPYLGGGAESKGAGLADANRLIGWLDLDSPAIVFDGEAFTPPPSAGRLIQRASTYSEYDYQFLGAWIDFLTGKRKDDLAKWLAHRNDPKNVAPPWKPSR